MYILAIKFDLNWFLTIPGMLITGGVLLLLIALIIFIATAGSSKKNKKGVNELVDGSEDKKIPMGDNIVAPAMDANGVAMNQPITEIPNNNIMPNDNNLNGVMGPSAVDLPQPSVTVVDGNQGVTGSMDNFVPPVIDQPQENSVSNTVSEPAINTETTPLEPTPEPSVSIYGGVSPTIPQDVVNSIPDQNARPIYGGNNPLDATQAIPTITPVEDTVDNSTNENDKNLTNTANDAVDNIINVQPTSVPVVEPSDNPMNSTIVADSTVDNNEGEVNSTDMVSEVKPDDAVETPSVNSVDEVENTPDQTTEPVLPAIEDNAVENVKPEVKEEQPKGEEIEVLDF